MKIFINVIACIVLIIQFLVACINGLIMQEPKTIVETLYNEFILISYFCSFAVVPVFILTYNFKYKYLESKIINFIFLVVVLFAAYIHLYQIFVQKDVMLTSCVLLLIDCYVVFKSIKIIKQDKTFT